MTAKLPNKKTSIRQIQRTRLMCKSHTDDKAAKGECCQLQKFSQSQEASDKLHRQGYYKLWPKGYYRDVVVSRQKTYKRILGG